MTKKNSPRLRKCLNKCKRMLWKVPDTLHRSKYLGMNSLAGESREFLKVSIVGSILNSAASTENSNTVGKV